MGYKLAGFDVLGGVEIDPKMSALYVANLKPKYEYLESVTEFEKRDDASLPPELFDLDVFDGSPPCSTFSTAGKRGKVWGKDKKFREGQAMQVLDSLPMCWARIVLKLRPKVAIMENVTGMMKGDAKGFVREVVAALAAAGYSAQVFQLDASRMGVPQKRQRIFVVARRDDLGLPPLSLDFNEPITTVRQAFEGIDRSGGTLLGKGVTRRVWQQTQPGDTFKHSHPTGAMFTWYKLHPDKPAPTLVATSTTCVWDEPRRLSRNEAQRIQSFPDDYDFGKEQATYVCGMSVPPLMTQRLALELRRQWLDRLPR